MQHPRRGLEHDIGSLERLDAAGEQQQRSVLGHTEHGPRLSLPAGAEDLEINTRVHDRDMFGLGVVHLDELAALLHRVGDEAVSEADDLLLAVDASDRLGVVALGEHRVLDLGHRVHRVDQRYVPPLAGDRAHLARQPVVRVDEVEVTRLALDLRAQDVAHERAQLRWQVVLLQALERAGRDVVHEDAGRCLDVLGLVAGCGTREDLDLDAPRGELSGQLEHVHVHAAGIAVSGLLEGRGVRREHRDSLEHRSAAFRLHRLTRCPAAACVAV